MTNKETVRTALHELFDNRDASALGRYWAAPYYQHNPGIADGVDVLKPMVTSTTGWHTYRLLAEGDFVVTHSLAQGWGPDPLVVFDVFLLRQGKMVEHWDIMQPQAEHTVSGHSQVDGPTEVQDADQTAANKQVVQGFFDDVLYGGRMNLLTTYISTTSYRQHNPGVGDGLAGFGEAMQQLQQAGLKMQYAKTYRLIADGNFVFAHSEGEFAGRHVAFADLFRLEGGKIVEHWDTIQDVVPAEQTISKHSMFEQVTT